MEALELEAVWAMWAEWEWAAREGWPVDMAPLDTVEDTREWEAPLAALEGLE